MRAFLAQRYPEMNTTVLEARPRSILGKKSRFLRRAGITPANLYGASIDSIAIQLDTHALHHILATTSRNTPVQIAVLGEEENRTAFIWEVQRHPLTDAILHVDLYHVEATRRMRARVPLVLSGVDADLEKFDKRVTQQLDAVEVETLPLDLPTEIDVDCSALTEIDDEVKVGSLTISDKVLLLTDPDTVVAKVSAIVILAEPEPKVGEEEETPEGEEAAEEGAAAAPAEAEEETSEE